MAGWNGCVRELSPSRRAQHLLRFRASTGSPMKQARCPSGSQSCNDVGSSFACRGSSGRQHIPVQRSPLRRCQELSFCRPRAWRQCSDCREAESHSIMPTHHAKRRPLVVANTRHGPIYGCALRLDRTPFDALLGHARKALSLRVEGQRLRVFRTPDRGSSEPNGVRLNSSILGLWRAF